MLALMYYSFYMGMGVDWDSWNRLKASSVEIIFGGEGENPGELCYKTKNNSPALQMSSKPRFPEAALSSDSVLAPSLLLGLCKTSVLISEKDSYYECHRAWLPQLSQQEFHHP